MEEDKKYTNVDTMASPNNQISSTRMNTITKTKQSYGVACCRISTLGVPEILLIQKRHTYSFVTFVFGCDYLHNHKQLRKLFDTMTQQEKLDILRLDYENLWCQICGKIPVQPPFDKYGKNRETPAHKHFNKAASKRNYSLSSWDAYIQRKSSFDTQYAGDNRVLSKLIHGTKSVNTLWDIPKGRRKTPEEKTFDIAIRELKEETSATILDITPMFHITPIINCYIDGKWKYINTYFVAEADSQVWKPVVNFLSHDQMTEVQDIQWFCLARLKALDPSSKYHQRLINIVEIILKKYKKARKT